MKSYTLRPDTFTLNFNLTLSGTLTAATSGPGEDLSKTDAQNEQDVANLKAREAATEGGSSALTISEAVCRAGGDDGDDDGDDDDDGDRGQSDSSDSSSSSDGSGSSSSLDVDAIDDYSANPPDHPGPDMSVSAAKQPNFEQDGSRSKSSGSSSPSSLSSGDSRSGSDSSSGSDSDSDSAGSRSPSRRKSKSKSKPKKSRR